MAIAGNGWLTRHPFFDEGLMTGIFRQSGVTDTRENIFIALRQILNKEWSLATALQMKHHFNDEAWLPHDSVIQSITMLESVHAAGISG